MLLPIVLQSMKATSKIDVEYYVDTNLEVASDSRGLLRNNIPLQSATGEGTDHTQRDQPTLMNSSGLLRNGGNDRNI